jgi:hypothetical protein
MKPWVQKLILQIQQFLQAQAEAGWLEIDQNKPQRVLDYACGNGTVSGVRPKSKPSSPDLTLIKKFRRSSALSPTPRFTVSTSQPRKSSVSTTKPLAYVRLIKPKPE